MFSIMSTKQREAYGIKIKMLYLVLTFRPKRILDLYFSIKIIKMQ
jgi:hypothetical protein